MPDESITLVNVTLGLEPYVLLTFRVAEDADLRVGIDAGGGITEDDLGSALWLALSNLPDGQNPVAGELTGLARERPELAEAITAVREVIGLGDAPEGS